MAADPILEQVYLDAARAFAGQLTHRRDEHREQAVQRCIADPPFRAAVEAARLATAREISAAANRPGSIPAASWRAAMDIIDDLERAARAAGKDKTDG